MKPFLLLFALVALSASAPGQTVLRKGDVFELRIGGVPAEVASEWAYQYTVGDNGTVKFPYIGEVRAADTSVADFARALERRLVQEKIFTQPTAVVTLRPETRFVTVGGEVRSPCSVPWSNGLTLWSAISRAGGNTDFARRAKLTREGKIRVVDFRKREKDASQNPTLLPGDEIDVF